MTDILSLPEEFRLDGPSPEFGVLSETELDTLPSEIGGAAFGLHNHNDVAEQPSDSLGGVMRQEDKPSMDPRNPLFENAGDETEAGMPVRNADEEEVPPPNTDTSSD